MRTDRIAGALLVAAGAGAALEATTFEVAFLTDPVGPKAMPFLAAALFLGGGLGLVLRPGPDPGWPGATTGVRMGAAVVAFLAYAAALPVLGFFVSTTLAMGALSMLFRGDWRRSLGAAAALSAVLWYLFVWALNLPLPLGSLWTR
jgi:putative tricarboxylic transport membrane protein